MAALEPRHGQGTRLRSLLTIGAISRTELSMTSESLLDQAALCLQKGDLWRAEFLYRQVIQHAPFSFEAHVQLAIILTQRGQTQEAAKTFEQALRLKPDNAIV